MVDPKQALAGDTLLFPDFGTNVVGSKDAADAADTFADCEVVLTQEILNQRVAVAPLEVRSAAAVWGSDGRLTAWIPNQGAQGTQGRLAALLGLAVEQVRVITPAVGGAFGAKFGADPEQAVVAWVARRLDRPATWVETRSENMVAMTHGRAQVQTITIGGDRDGNVKAYRLHVLQDSGAYPRFGAMLPMLTLLMAPAVYDIDRIETSYVSVVTTTTPVGAYRGAGRPEATAVIERAMDLFAAEIGMDPAQVRRRNLLPAFTEPVTARAARSTTPVITRWPWTPSSPPLTTRHCGPIRPPAANVVTRCSWASGSACTSRSPAGAARPALRARTPRSRCIPTARPRS